MISLGISIRKAQKKDAPVMLDINRNAIFAVHDFLYPEDAKQAWALSNTETIEGIIGSEKYQTVVATIHGKVVGFGTCKGNQVRLLYVYPEYQNRGVASNILRHLERHLSSPIFKVSKNSVAFYQRHGYKIQGKSKTVLKEKPIDTFVVYKD